jgi:Choline dehydrogenase and related flavoproteins
VRLPWGQDPDVDFLRGYGYQGGAYREGWTRALGEEGFGASLKHKLRDPGKWRMYLTGFGEMLPDENNYVELDDEATDEWGIPQLRMNVSLSENAEAMRADTKTQAAEMLEAAGATEVEPYEQRYWPREGIHEMDGARMGRDPETSVLNAHNQTHDVPNLFVTDGACMASASCQNPSITCMALTAWAVDYAVEAMKRDRL